MNPQERYWQSVAKRNPESAVKADAERSFKCLCCYDRGILPTHVVERYLSHLFEDDGFGAQNLAPYACARSQCSADFTEIEIPGKTDGESGEDQPMRKRVPRFASYGLNQDLDSNLCQWIHGQEFERLRSMERDAKPIDPRSLVQEALAKVGQPMPEASKFDMAEPIEITDAIASLIEDDLETLPQDDPMGGFQMPPIQALESVPIRVGDRIVIAIDHLDDWSQKEVVKNNELPVGMMGRVLRLFPSHVAELMGKKGELDAAVKLADGNEYELPIEFLRRAS